MVTTIYYYVTKIMKKLQKIGSLKTFDAHSIIKGSAFISAEFFLTITLGPLF